MLRRRSNTESVPHHNHIRCGSLILERVPHHLHVGCGPVVEPVTHVWGGSVQHERLRVHVERMVMALLGRDGALVL